MRRDYVLATEWIVSTTTGYGIEGAILDVYKIVPRKPTPDDPMKVKVISAIQQMPFPDRDSAREYAFQQGYLKVYNPEEC